MNTESESIAPASQTCEKIENAFSTARERTGAIVARGETYVRQRPGFSLLSAFAIGVTVGAVVAAASRPATRSCGIADSLGESRERLAALLGNVASNLRGPAGKTYAALEDGISSLTRTLEKAAPEKLRWW